jgi:rod shape-determining protein MreC
MRGFLSRYKILLLLIGLVLLGLHLASSSMNKGADTTRTGRVIITIYAPIHKTILWPFWKMGELADRYIWLVNLKEENDRLKRDNETLLFQNSKNAEVEFENERLRKLLGFKIEAKADPIYAKVIARNVSQEFRVILIGKGTREGVRKNMIAVTAEGLVGHVNDVTDNAAKVLLVTDPSSVVDAVIQRTRVSGLVKGRGAPACSMDFIRRTDDVQVGDSVVSSGIGGIFTKGFAIGQVINVDNESNDMFKSVDVKPYVTFDGLEEVIILPGSALPPSEARPETKEKP